MLYYILHMRHNKLVSFCCFFFFSFSFLVGKDNCVNPAYKCDDVKRVRRYLCDKFLVEFFFYHFLLIIFLFQKRFFKYLIEFQDFICQTESHSETEKEMNRGKITLIFVETYFLFSYFLISIFYRASSYISFQSLETQNEIEVAVERKMFA